MLYIIYFQSIAKTLTQTWLVSVLRSLRKWLGRETPLHTLRRWGWPRGGWPQWRPAHHQRPDRYEASSRPFSHPGLVGKMDLAPPLCWEKNKAAWNIERISWLQDARNSKYFRFNALSCQPWQWESKTLGGPSWQLESKTLGDQPCEADQWANL